MEELKKLAGCGKMRPLPGPVLTPLQAMRKLARSPASQDDAVAVTEVAGEREENTRPIEPNTEPIAITLQVEANLVKGDSMLEEGQLKGRRSARERAERRAVRQEARLRASQREAEFSLAQAQTKCTCCKRCKEQGSKRYSK